MTLVLAAALLAQAAQKHPPVDQRKIDDAIERACRWVADRGSGTSLEFGRRQMARDTLVPITALALAHSGYYEEGTQLRQLQALVAEMGRADITSTYGAALQAMALQQIAMTSKELKKYRRRIAQCAQFLVDNQCENGQWDYGAPTNIGRVPEDVSEPETGGTRSVKKFPVLRIAGGKGRASGDNSNSQYAALGLRACLDAEIGIEDEVLRRASEWWGKCQNSDGGWGYATDGKIDPSAKPLSEEGEDDSFSEWSYGSMTAGAVGSLCIYKYFLKQDYKNEGSVRRGLDWLAAHYSVVKNPRKGTRFGYLYYLYALERAGILYGTEKIGGEWYKDGVLALLASQQGDGAWNTGDKYSLGGVADTCYGILFLRRGTRPLKPIIIQTGMPSKK